MLLWHLCGALQDLLLQPRGGTEREFGPGTTRLLGHLDRAITNSPLESPVRHLFILSEFSAGAGEAMDWVFSVFTLNPCAQVGAGFLVSRISPMCLEFLFPWDLRCNGNTATAGTRLQASHQCHKAKGFLWLWLISWLA